MSVFNDINLTAAVEAAARQKYAEQRDRWAKASTDSDSKFYWPEEFSNLDGTVQYQFRSEVLPIVEKVAPVLVIQALRMAAYEVVKHNEAAEKLLNLAEEVESRDGGTD